MIAAGATKEEILKKQFEVTQKEYDVEHDIIAQTDHEKRFNLKRDIIYADKIDATSGWQNLGAQYEEINSVEDAFEEAEEADERSTGTSY